MLCNRMLWLESIAQNTYVACSLALEVVRKMNRLCTLLESNYLTLRVVSTKLYVCFN
jgi:hypothetical protein